MPNIQLKAKLQAYSRAPFYADWVRDITSLPDYDPEANYIRCTDENGEIKWKKIDVKYCDETTLERFIKEISDDNAYAKNIRIIKPNTSYNKNDPTDLEKILPSNAFGFYDWDNQLNIVQFPYLCEPDHNTIDINEEGKLCAKNLPDERSLKTDRDNNQLKVEAIFTSDGLLISGDFIHSSILNIVQDVDSLKQTVQDQGGQLNPYNFESSNPTEEDLSLYCKDQLVKDPSSTYSLKRNIFEEVIIPNCTKVKNLFDGSVWIYVDGKWYNKGIETIVAANNDGVLGTVTGSNDKYKISIDKNENGQSLGTMTVNGVEEEFSKVVYSQINRENLPQAYIQTSGENQTQQLLNIDTNGNGNTLVQRTINGCINCETPQNSNDKKSAINIEWMEKWLINNTATDEEIDQLLQSIFFDEEEVSE